jgi:predicted metal-dependent hydrolase
MNIEILRSARRTISLRLIDHETLRVSAPLGYPAAYIDAFVKSKQRWIERHQRELHAQSLEKSTTHPILFLGKSMTLCQGVTRHILIDGDTLVLPAVTNAADLISWLKLRARELFAVRLEYWSKHMHLAYNTWRLKENSTNWGSCSTRKNINLNWRLIQCDLPIIDYVIIHELAHLQQMNHSPAYWRIVAQHDADYQQHRTWLKKWGYTLQYLTAESNIWH